MKTFAWVALLIIEVAFIGGTAFGAQTFWNRFSELQAQRTPFESEIYISQEMCVLPTEGINHFLFLTLNSSEFVETKRALQELAAGEGREIVSFSESEGTRFVNGRVEPQSIFNLTFFAAEEDAEQLLEEIRILPKISFEFESKSTNAQVARASQKECERVLHVSRTLQLYEQFYLRQLIEGEEYDEKLADKVNNMRNTASILQEGPPDDYYAPGRTSVIITLRETR